MCNQNRAVKRSLIHVFAIFINELIIEPITELINKLINKQDCEILRPH
jgi:hypothetical protein